ncbi:MAG: DUF3048 domain-containing protein [Anaerolineae bacterium]|nr:DUF3048 domain-containing protein [Anaerolineae bacterium]
MVLRQRWIGWGVVLLLIWGGGLLAAACSPSSPSWQEISAKVATFTPTPALKSSPILIGATSEPAVSGGTSEAAASDVVPASALAEATQPLRTPVGMRTPVVVTYRTPEATRTPTRTPTAAAPTPTPTVVIPERPEGENPLTGLIVSDPGVLKRRPIAVRVGNDPGARPQAGLMSADVVYEEIVEWWVTRFTAIYLSEDPQVVAPIRSARLINAQLTMQYQAALASSGGSDGVRWELSQLPIVNLDEYFYPQPYFYRKNENWQRRLALDVSAARALMAKKNMEAPVVLRGFIFSDTPVGGQKAETIFIPYPRRTSLTLWRYDPSRERYLRWVAGEPLLDATTQQQIAAANVIVYYAPHEPTDIVEDSKGATSIRIIVNGEGRVQVFRDGVVMEGLWRTDGTQTPEFVFPNGEPIPLKRGNSWIEVVPPEYQVLVNATPTPASGG